MKKIQIFLDYKCFPMWIYNEKGELVENELVEELKNEPEIYKMLWEIQSIYDGLFNDNEISFEYNGFEKQSDKIDFLKRTEEIITLISEKVGEIYLIENRVIV